MQGGRLRSVGERCRSLGTFHGWGGVLRRSVDGAETVFRRFIDGAKTVQRQFRDGAETVWQPVGIVLAKIRFRDGAETV